PKAIPHKDHYCRVNFLHQASTLLVNPKSPSLKHVKYEILSRAYSRSMDLVAKKVVLKTTPLLKRSGCKKCHRRLVVGISATMEMENLSKKNNTKSEVLCITCVGCGCVKRFPVGLNPAYELFSERAD
ncbi:hypothetical protein BABINDRAFT_26946, partial [Babjeviella inositovora NRRL Y-12698]